MRHLYDRRKRHPRAPEGTAWFRLAPGTRVQEGDIFDAPTEYAQLQLEWAAGSTVNVHGPALGMSPAFLRPTKSAATDLVVQRGWLKAAMPAGRPLRLRLPAATVDLADAIVVVRGDPGQFELFVESGNRQGLGAVARSKPPPPLRRADGRVRVARGRSRARRGQPPAAGASCPRCRGNSAMRWRRLARTFRRRPSLALAAALAEASPGSAQAAGRS